MEKENCSISKHAKERYTERILNKCDSNEIQLFIIQNEDKIQVDINKMIAYGELIYSGKQCGKNNNSNVINVYRKDMWIILLDVKNNTVITLYKIDLGCGEDFNSEYMTRMLKKLSKSQSDLSKTENRVAEESTLYKELMEQNNLQINEYRTYIKNLEELNKGYKMILDNNIVHVSGANKVVTDTVNTLIGKKEF